MNATPEKTVSRGAARARRGPCGPDQGHERARGDEEARRGEVGRARSHDVDETAEGGPHDLGGLPGGDDPGHRPRDEGRGTTSGTSAVMAGFSKACAAPSSDDQAEDARLALPAADRAQGEGRGRGGLHRLAQRRDQATIAPIGHLPDHQGEDHHRQELGEADQPQVERAAGEGVELPAHRDAEHGEPHVGEDARGQQQRERRVAQQRGIRNRALVSAVGAGQHRVEEHVHTRRGVVELGVLGLVVGDAVAARGEDHGGRRDARDVVGVVAGLAQDVAVRDTAAAGPPRGSGTSPVPATP